MTGDVCGFLNGTYMTPAVQWAIQLTKRSIDPSLIHPCPSVQSNLDIYIRNSMNLWNNLQVQWKSHSEELFPGPGSFSHSLAGWLLQINNHTF